MQELALHAGAVVVDATVGDGGHAALMLNAISPGGFLIGIDRDLEATKVAYENLSLKKSNAKFVIVHGSFSHLDHILEDAGYRGIDAILFDLGLSSRELMPARGFSFLHDAPLDMRFDNSAGQTAADIVNSYPKDKLADLIYEFGEERASRRIADAIFIARRKHRITSTVELADIITQAKGGRRGKIHPATQTFQALRIATNDELANLQAVLPQALRLLKPGGRFVLGVYGKHGLFPYCLALARFFTVTLPIVPEKLVSKLAELLRLNPIWRYQVLDYLYVPILRRYSPAQVKEMFLKYNFAFSTFSSLP